MTVLTGRITEEGARYSIDLKYPQTGLASVDTRARQLIDAAIDGVKKGAQLDTSSAGKYTVGGSFTTSLAGPDVVSIRLDISTYAGGAHGGNRVHGLNFEVASGRELTLDDALAMMGSTLAQVADQANAQLKAKLGQSMFPEGATAKRENYATFVISKDEVTFFFQEYQVAPYAAGVQQVSLPRKTTGSR